MKIVFFSDAHGNQHTVRKFFDSIKADDPDLIVFGGDIFGYYYGQADILDMLYHSKCICLLGNHDKYFLELVEGKVDEDYLVSRYGSTYRNIINSIPQKYVDFLYTLKSRYDLVIDDEHYVFVHGTVDDPINGRIYPDTTVDDMTPYNNIDYVFMGHTHHKLFKRLGNGTTLINPGSIGQQRDGKGCTYIIFDTSDKKCIVKEISYKIEELVNDIKSHNEENTMRDKLIEVLYRKNK